MVLAVSLVVVVVVVVVKAVLMVTGDDGVMRTCMYVRTRVRTV